MHEYALVQDLIEQVLTTMRTQRLSLAKSIEVNVGSSSGFSAESIKQAYEILSAETELNGATLVIKEVDGRDVVLQRMTLEE